MVATRLESRKSLLGADPGFAEQGMQYQDNYAPNQSYPDAYPDAYTQNYPNGPYAQPSLAHPTYAENAHMVGDDFNQGYAGREGLTSSHAVSTHHNGIEFLKRKWPAAFMAITGFQAIICLGFEAYVFGKFQLSLGPYVEDPRVQSQYLTIPTFLALFIFGFLYELVIVWDALRMKNTIQVIGVCIANLAMLVYTAIQVDQIQMAITVLAKYNALAAGISSPELWSDIKAFLVATPAIIALATAGMVLCAWKLYQEFAWDILKNIGADYRMKKRFLHYQIYIALLKFDFFFFLGFIIQFSVVVAKKTDPEFAVTVASIPVTIAILLAAAYFTKKENTAGMAVTLFFYLGGLVYFVFKLVRIYQPYYRDFYVAVRKSLTAFAVITILLIILTIANGIICMRNFGAGLKPHLQSTKKVEENPDAMSFSLNDVKAAVPSRMTID